MAPGDPEDVEKLLSRRGEAAEWPSSRTRPSRDPLEHWQHGAHLTRLRGAIAPDRAPRSLTRRAAGAGAVTVAGAVKIVAA